jgi:intracellular multiplication protein IcmJ
MTISILRGAAYDVAYEFKDVNFLKMAKKVVNRDNNICHLCKFQSFSFVRVLKLESAGQSLENDVDVPPLNPKHYKTTCAICFESQRLKYAVDLNYGRLIYLPEVSQAQLNSIVHFTLSVIEDDVDEAHKSQMQHVKRAMRTDYALLQSREVALKEIFSLDSTIELVDFLLKMPDSAYSQRHKFMDGVRYLPDLNAYQKRAEKWKQREYVNFKPTMWSSYAAKYFPEIFAKWNNLPENDDFVACMPRFIDE